MIRAIGFMDAGERRARPARVARLAGVGVGVALCILGLTLLAAKNDHAVLGAAGETEAAAEPGDWVGAPRPIALFGLEAPELIGARRGYESRRRSGEREDNLAFNDFDGDKLYLTLRFHRPGATHAPSGSLFVEAARHAGQRGLAVERMATSVDTPSKFGPVETADALVASSEGKRACMALRFAIAGEALTVVGLVCGAGGQAPERPLMSCMIDRVTLLAPGDDNRIRLAFVRAELNRRSACGRAAN